MSELKLRAIPQVPTAINPQLRAVLLAIKENFEILTQQRGDVDVVSALLGYTPAAQLDNIPPAGAVLFFAQATAPVGWLVCDGAVVSRTSYAKLFAAIGTTYGAGDGVTTFKLPELRGEFIRGLDSGRGVDSGRALGSAQAALLADHGHAFLTPRNGTDGATSFMSDSSGVGSPTGVSGDNRPRNVALLPCISTGVVAWPL